MANESQKPIINCHAHLYTAGHVPPWLAKTFIPWPLFYLLSVPTVVSLFKCWYNGPYAWQFRPWYKAAARRLYLAKEFLARTFLLNLLYNLAGSFLTVQVFFILYGWLSKLVAPDSAKEGSYVQQAADWLRRYHLLYPAIGWFWKLILVFLLCLFFASGRNFILFIFRNLWSFLGSLPGKQTLELFRRYLNIGRYAFHDKQATTFRQLQGQYPPGTRFVILPMDMAFMAAGKPKIDYYRQMEELAALKEQCPDVLLPFIFVDPRRIAGDPAYFNYQSGPDGKIVLLDCFVKTYIEDKGFAGFKIYPALGYYPFDERLLPLWKYAAENGLPVLTHCIRGTIFYRGSKKKEWDMHPIFTQASGDQQYEPLLLPQMKNIQFVDNFTHPLNFLCLLDKTLLAKLVQKAAPDVRAAFGYDDRTGEMKSDLSGLKLCFAHFGGEEEWDRYFEADRYGYAAQLDRHPDRGIDFTHHDFTPHAPGNDAPGSDAPGSDGPARDVSPSDAPSSDAPGKLEQIWKSVDWYSIICSMMLQYPNVYSDISYILHSPDILPLLTKTLQPASGRLRDRVLFGTDFYLVRNYKSDKNMLADMLAGLTDDEFNLIARENPSTFLK